MGDVIGPVILGIIISILGIRNGGLHPLTHIIRKCRRAI